MTLGSRHLAAGAAFALVASTATPGCKHSDTPASTSPSAASTSADADIEKKIVEVVAESLRIPPSKVRPESRLIQDLGADSLDFVEIIMALEEEFDVTVSDEVAVKLTTISSFVTTFSALKHPKPGTGSL